LGIWQKPDLIWSDAYNDRYAVYDARKTWADKRFFYIYSRGRTYLTSLLAYLNTSAIPLVIEMDGITNLGEGAIYTNVYQLQKLGIPLLGGEVENRVLPILRRLEGRHVESIFSELGASSPDEVSLDKVKPDRREVDKIIMGEILGLTEEEQLEVYRAVVDLVKSRLGKAKSFGKRKKTKEGIDIDLVVKLVMEKVGEDTLGKFYTEKVLSQSPLETKSRPPPVVISVLSRASWTGGSILASRALTAPQSWKPAK